MYLGDDEHGTWLGFPAGTHMVRPGAEYVSPTDQLGLVPPTSWPDAERGWLATFHGAGGPLSVYVDVTAPPTWSGSTLTAIDLDLDVVRELGRPGLGRRRGRVRRAPGVPGLSRPRSSTPPAPPATAWSRSSAAATRRTTASAGPWFDVLAPLVEEARSACHETRPEVS